MPLKTGYCQIILNIKIKFPALYRRLPSSATTSCRTSGISYNASCPCARQVYGFVGRNVSVSAFAAFVITRDLLYAKRKCHTYNKLHESYTDRQDERPDGLFKCHKILPTANIANKNIVEFRPMTISIVKSLLSDCSLCLIISIRLFSNCSF